MEFSRDSASQAPTSYAEPVHKTRANLRYKYTWKIDSVCNPQHTVVKQTMQSPVFSFGPKSQLRWSLILYPKGQDLQSLSSLFLCCENLTKSDVKAKFSFRLTHPRLATVTSPEMTEYCVFTHRPQTSRCGYEKFIHDLCSYSNPFDIYCEIELYPNDGNGEDQGAGEPFQVPDCKLLDDMVSVFTTEKHTDFMIIHNKVAFPVHKAILSARSSVFASMFEHEMKEQQENCVDIDDTTPEALKEMLRFIYTGKVEGIETVAHDLLAAAEKYALDRLKVMCEEALRVTLTVENAAEILIHADLHRADRLKARAIDFINRQSVDVMHTSGFNSMITSHPHLTAEILRAIMSKTNRDGDV